MPIYLWKYEHYTNKLKAQENNIKNTWLRTSISNSIDELLLEISELYSELIKENALPVQSILDSKGRPLKS